MKYLYAITRAGVDLPGRPGLSRAPLESIRYADIQVVCSDLGPVNLDVPDAASLWAHEEVVEAVDATCDAVLPVRFGSTVRDRPRAVALLAGRHDEFVWALERVRGSVEIGVRVVRAPPPQPAHNGVTTARMNGTPVVGMVRGSPRLTDLREGSAYLRGRAGEQSRAEELAERVHVPLSRLAKAAHKSSFVVPPTILAASYLAPREILDEFLASVAAISHDCPDLWVVCTGPWPPYSFTNDGGGWPLGSVAS